MGRRRNPLRAGVFAVAAWLAAAAGAQAQDLRPAGKLLLTGGVSSIEGAAGGGLASWAVITGYGATEGVGANAHGTVARLPDYEFRTYGAAVGVFDRLEVSYARQEFDTGKTGAALGLGRGFTFGQDIFGAKLRVAGDAVYDQDRLLPQIAVGFQAKDADQGAIIRALGGARDKDVDYYVAATKVLLDRSVVLSGTIRATRANQTGLLGFGAPGDDDYSLQFEGSAGVLVSKRLLLGAEYRTKPDRLGLKEDDWLDLFAAYAVNKNLSITAAYLDLGEIATFKDQRGLYVSLQAGF